MQRTSETIGTLAAALAKAQLQLTNPEKSLVATIRVNDPSETEQTFRYAPLSSGLEIVRKTLGDQEIATVQTTSIDQAAGIVNLTTVLAHSSGEWIASDWPVCPISETATPHRMGAALTYARRYALFTLVGIAGEDDLDAPDLAAPSKPRPEPEKPKNDTGAQLNGGRRSHVKHAKSAEPLLSLDELAELRDRLVAEVNELETGENAAIWAHRRLPEKNKLSETDAQQVEDIFRAKLATFASQEETQPPTSRRNEKKPKARRRYGPVDKSVLSLPEPRRTRDREHVKSVAKRPCLICGRQPADAHHLRFAQSRALGRKVSDEYTVPLCRGHHREAHRYGDEIAWWKKAGVDPTVTARALWLETHPLPMTLDKTVLEGATSLAAVGTEQRNGKRDRSIEKRGRKYKTKPITAADPSSAVSKRTPGI